MKLLVAAILLTTTLLMATLAPPDEKHSATFYVFGTLVEVVVRDVPEREAEVAFAHIASLFNDLHHAWHAWRPGELSNLNAALADGRAAPVDAELMAVLRQARALSCRSGGLFEPGIGRLVALWGFHDDAPPSGAPPMASEVAALTAASPRIAELGISDGLVTSPNPAMQIDLGAIAKGAALDLAARELHTLGIEHAVLNGGGDVNVIGVHGTRPWRVAIRDPFEWGAVAGIELAAGEVLYTSGNYERYFEHEGQRFAHILDPRTGYPVQDIVSVSVLHTNGAVADAAATALSVAGSTDWPGVARAMGLDAVLVIDEQGQMTATPAMAARLVSLPGNAAPSPEIVTLPDVIPAEIAAFQARHCARTG